MNPIAKMIIDMAFLGLEKVLGRFYSKYRAFVVDNKDPKGYGRLQLMIPGVNDNPLDYWAWGTGQFNGKNFGGHFIPPKGTMVWVEFELGDPKKPIWSHGSFGKPSEIDEDHSDPENFWFITPKGNSIYLNDAKGEIIIQDKDLQVIKMDKDGISIVSKKEIHLTGDIKDTKEPIAIANKVIGQIEGLAKSVTSGFSNIQNSLSSISSLTSKLGLAVNPAAMLGVAAIEGLKTIKEITQNKLESDKHNKAISSLLDKLPEIKSKRVLIDK